LGCHMVLHIGRFEIVLKNGCFKMALTKAKQELVEKKNDAGLVFAIYKTDVVWLVQKA
jgi:hypothetical protein